MHSRKYTTACLILTAVLLTGCSATPDSLVETTWKLTSLTTPSGTEYDERAYDAIIGETFYCFETDGSMISSVGGEEDDSAYTYSYEDGELKISSEDLECSGTVKGHEMKLQLGEQGVAVLTEQTVSDKK